MNTGIGIGFSYLAVSVLLSLSSQFLGLFSGQMGSRAKARLAALVAEHARYCTLSRHMLEGPNKTVLHKWSVQPRELWVFQGPVRSYKSALSPPSLPQASLPLLCVCAFILLLQAHCSRPSPATSPSRLMPACGWGTE